MKTPLPMSWVDKIFKKLTLVHGRDFLSKWEGLDMNDVKVDWAHELAGLQENPACIRHALENMPSAKPPTVLEFRALALKCPAPAAPALPAPGLDAEVAAGFIGKAKAAQERGVASPKDWAHTIIRRHEAGEKIGLYSLNLARSAIAPNAISGGAA